MNRKRKILLEPSIIVILLGVGYKLIMGIQKNERVILESKYINRLEVLLDVDGNEVS